MEVTEPRPALQGETPQKRGGVAQGPTRAQVVEKWGRQMAADLRMGRSILQREQTARPPTTLPLVRRDGRGNLSTPPPHTFRGMNPLILRTVAAAHGLPDTRFAMRQQAESFNEQHGVTNIRNVVADYKGRIELPNSSKASDLAYVEKRDVKLAKDGPNFDHEGRPIEGKAGDFVRDEKGRKCRETVVFEGIRKEHGKRDYYNVDHLDLPALEPRAPVRENAREYYATNLMTPARLAGLETREDKEMLGKVSLSAHKETAPDGTERDSFVLTSGPESSFPSRDAYLSALTHEVCRFHQCRDGDADALATARAKPEDRIGMPEYARSELTASAASLERMTEVGSKWHPPAYPPERQRDIREAQAQVLEVPEGLADLGERVHRTFRLSNGQAPTSYEQRQRNQERREQQPTVDTAARGFGHTPTGTRIATGQVIDPAGGGPGGGQQQAPPPTASPAPPAQAVRNEPAPEKPAPAKATAEPPAREPAAAVPAPDKPASGKPDRVPAAGGAAAAAREATAGRPGRGAAAQPPIGKDAPASPSAPEPAAGARASKRRSRQRDRAGDKPNH